MDRRAPAMHTPTIPLRAFRVDEPAGIPAQGELHLAGGRRHPPRRLQGARVRRRHPPLRGAAAPRLRAPRPEGPGARGARAVQGQAGPGRARAGDPEQHEGAALLQHLPLRPRAPHRRREQRRGELQRLRQRLLVQRSRDPGELQPGPHHREAGEERPALPDVRQVHRGGPAPGPRLEPRDGVHLRGAAAALLGDEQRDGR